MRERRGGFTIDLFRYRPCDRTTYISRARFDTRNAADAIRHAVAQTETIQHTAMVRVYRRRRKDSATPPAEFIVLFSGIYNK